MSSVNEYTYTVTVTVDPLIGDMLRERIPFNPSALRWEIEDALTLMVHDRPSITDFTVTYRQTTA